MKKIILLLLLTSIIACENEKCDCIPDDDSVIEDWKQLNFLTVQEWEGANVIIDFQFEYAEKNIESELRITNDSVNIYILLSIYDDDYFLGRNDSAEWADDRFSIIFDEGYDNIFTDLGEDMTTFRTSDFHVGNTSFDSPAAANGDWYYENDEKTWEYSKELDWEIENISDQRYKGGDDAKEIYLSHSKEFINGIIQDFQFEIKIPFNSRDPYDLQCRIGDAIGICIYTSNRADGSASFPKNTDAYSPENYYEYILE